MRNLKFILIAILAFSNLTAQKKSINNKLTACLNEPKLHSWFGICEKKTDTVCVYDNTKKFKNFNPVKIPCNKVLISQKSSIKIDINIYNPYNTDKIVLYKYEVKNGKYKLFFVNILNNANMVIELNSANKVINYSTGIF